AEALGVARAVRPHYWITYALYWQGCVAQASGDLAAARVAFDEGVALALEDGYNAPIAHLATMRGRLALAEGDSAGALGSFAVGLASLKRTKNHWSTIILVEDLARIAADRGDAARAARLLGAAANLREEAGAAPLPLEREILDRLTGSVRSSLGVAAFDAAFEAGQALSLSSALDLAESMVGQPAGATHPHGKDAASLTRALALYRGDFLEDVTAGDWCLEHRDRWRRLYVEGKPALGEPA